jgi:hypothetical protein
MNDFPSPPTDSMGGLASFQFMDVEGVASLGTRLNAVVSSIVLKTGFAFHIGYSSIDALKYDEKAN